MTHVSIIGNGNLGRAISGIVTAGGNTVEVFGRDDTKPAAAEIAAALPQSRVLKALNTRQPCSSPAMTPRQRVCWPA
jgi:8-hydroxy-5-deazaflavin:NADPH oxidoreductase